VPTHGWMQAKTDQYGSALEAGTKGGKKPLLVRANIKETGAQEGLVNVHVRTAAGTWTSVAIGPEGSVLDVVSGGSLDANQERLNESRRERREKAAAN
jgi:hypothetical protein